MENEFKNGLIGHRIETKPYSDVPSKTCTIIDKVNIGEIETFHSGKLANNSDMYLGVSDDGFTHLIEPRMIRRVIRPQGEVVKPAEPEAEPYSVATEGDRKRLSSELLIPNGWVVSDDDLFETIMGYTVADKGFDRIKIDETGVYLIARLPEDPRAGYVYDAYNGITIPLNDWVKNPTVESLKPKE